MKKRTKSRKTKHVVWLNNHTDSRDDEWKAVWAHDKKEAKKIVGESAYGSHRFSLGNVYTIKEFRREFGRDWPV